MDKRIGDLVEFTIDKNSEEEVLASFNVSDKLPSFEGHFPSNPILPAVSIIDISLYLLGNRESDVVFNRVSLKRSKFMGMVRPLQQVAIHAEKKAHREWIVVWCDQKSLAKLALVHLVL